jgi:hypothetical protein
MAGTSPYTQWQTARAGVVAVDTPLTNYKPADLTAAVRAKMFSIHPATAILLRAFGIGSNNDSGSFILSGWMKPDKPRIGGVQSCGPGHRLFRGAFILGNKSLGGGLPSEDKKWLAGTYLEVDTFDPALGSGYNPVGATRLEQADQESVLLVPTLGYTDILIEVPSLTLVGSVTNIGFLWRPATVGGVIKTF